MFRSTGQCGRIGKVKELKVLKSVDRKIDDAGKRVPGMVDLVRETALTRCVTDHG